MKCERLTDEDVGLLSKVSVPYLCASCISKPDGAYDFDKALYRMGTASRKVLKYLVSVLQVEFIFLRNEKEITCVENGEIGLSTDFDTDTQAQDIISTCYPNETVVPVAVSGDGNCLFNAVSKLLSGNESLAKELRVRTAIEMATNIDMYQTDPKLIKTEIFSPSYTESLRDCARSGGYSSAWTIKSLASVLRRTISVLYPPMNGLDDLAHKALTTEYTPLNIFNEKPLRIMWSRLGKRAKLWSANHFVPLFAPRFNLPNVTCRQVSEVEYVNQSVDVEINYDALHECSSILTQSPNLPVSKEPTCNKDRSSASTTGDVNQPLNSTMISVPDVSIQTEKLSGPMKPLSIEDIFQLILNLKTSSEILEAIPTGNKSNSRFLVDNNENIEKHKMKERMCHTDDCGAWDGTKATTTNTTYLIENGQKIKTIAIKSGIYCYPKKIKKKIIWSPFDPQPDPTRIVTAHRYYTVLNKDNSFRKRVTWINISRDYAKVPNVAVVEYMGNQPDEGNCHGNAKGQLSNPYVRTDSGIMNKIKQEVKHAMPKQIMKKMIEEANDSMSLPRNVKQITDARYRTKKGTSGQYSANIADDLLKVFNMVNDHPFVQEVVHTKGKPPSIILYLDEQMDDLRSFVAAKTDYVIGVDRTFNMGPCYVTSIVYKNLKVVKADTKDNPIMMGPMFLHWDGSFDSYQPFFAHIKRKLDDTDFPATEILIGSDEEKALVKALKSVFPDATQYLCTKHLKDNVNRYLQDDVGANTKDRVGIVRDVFDGLANADDTLIFEQQANDLLTTHGVKYPKFATYFENRLKHLLLCHVNQPHRKDSHKKLWTNNNSESMNHQMKISVDWKSQKVPDLIIALHAEINLQMLNIRRCLHGLGDYVLLPRFRKRFYIPEATWRTKSEEEKINHFKKFLKSTLTKEPELEIIHATGTEYHIPKVPSLAKKPGQRKRVRSERTAPRF